MRWSFEKLIRAPRQLLDVDPGSLDFQLLGRMLTLCALIGLVGGLMSAGFFIGLEWIQELLLGRLAGYEPLRATGERIGASVTATPFRPWLLPLIPALGALAQACLASPLLAGERRRVEPR